MKAVNKTKEKSMDQRTSIYIRVLHQEAGVSIKELKQRFPKFSERTIYRHAKDESPTDKIDQRKYNKGRPKKINARYERTILRTLKILRKKSAHFTSRDIIEEADLTGVVSRRTVRRILNKNNYRYLQARKKGLLKEKDKRERVSFARKYVKYGVDFWKKEIAFYFDGVGFGHKTNPQEEARSNKSMMWRQPKEGLTKTTKGKKEGTGGRVVRFFVGIAHDKGVVLVKQYPWNVTGERFARFVRNVFPETFRICEKNIIGGLFLQDGDPRQVSNAAKMAWKNLGCEMFSIPPRSPDLNPIENIFHLVRQQLDKDALENEITHETYDVFAKRAAKTLQEFPVSIINKTIESMPKRLRMVIKSRGERTKY